MNSKSHLSLIKQMIAEDEAAIARLGKLPASTDDTCTANLAGKSRRAPEVREDWEDRERQDRQLVKLCLERGLEGLKLKLDAMTDCLDHTAVKPRVAAPPRTSQLSH